MFTAFISTADLATHLDDPNFIVVDCRSNLTDHEAGRRAYTAAHIPNALFAQLEDDLSGPLTGSNGRHPLPTPEALVKTFSTLGIGPNTQVVAYDDSGAAGGLGAARLWWLLRYMGHTAVAVLEGGWTIWLAEGRPTQAGALTHAPTQFVGEPQPALMVEADSLLNSGLTIIDSRAAPRYRGEVEPIDRVAGHIPGARNFFYGLLTTPDGHLLPTDEFKAKLKAVLGDTPPGQTVFYCGSGVSAAANLLAMEAAGLSGAKLYPGSWSEWSSDPARPVATGDETPKPNP